MPRKPTTKPLTSSTSNKNQKKLLKTLRLTRRDSDDALEPSSKKQRTHFACSNPPVFDLIKDGTISSSRSQGSAGSSRLAKPACQSQRHLVDVKGKDKEIETLVDDEDVILWVDKYQPTSEAELAVHRRKVEDVRRWLLEAFEGGPSGKLKKYRRILALTGPAGTAKTSTLQVLSREMDFEILEWRNSMSERGPSTVANEELRRDEEWDFDMETLFDKFQAFLTRATTCNSIFRRCNATQNPSQAQSSTQHSSKRQVVLLEDLPNVLHQPTQVRFQAALRSLCFFVSNLSEPSGPPIVIILSDSGLRAEQPEDCIWEGGSNGRRWDKKEVLDIRNVLGPELLTSPYVTRIGFNPIAPTLMTKALLSLLASHFGSLEAHERLRKQPAREVVDIIVESSNGDIRSAIMALQFACVVDLPPSSNRKTGRRYVGETKTMTNASVRAVLETVSRREQSLVLFHLMGKILYNKRKFDSPASHLSAKDAAKERELDLHLIDPAPLPAWLSHHNRKASRVCTEALAVESPIDSSLLGMYTHQNYTQFCTDIDQCDGVCEGLSWVDCIGGAQHGNSPYMFPTLTLSTLHSLPTPVPRMGQKVCKPTWFDFHACELEAWDAVGDVLGWLGRSMVAGNDTDGESSVSVGKWTYANIAMDLGGWLRVLDGCSGDTHPVESQGQRGPYPRPPQTHRLFSYLPWSLTAVGGDTLGENDNGEVEGDRGGGKGGDVTLPSRLQAGEEGRGWLEEDDIEHVE